MKEESGNNLRDCLSVSFAGSTIKGRANLTSGMVDTYCIIAILRRCVPPTILAGLARAAYGKQFVNNFESSIVGTVDSVLRTILFDESCRDSPPHD